MPTGPKHIRSYSIARVPEGMKFFTNGDYIHEDVDEECRCMIGEDHNDSDNLSEEDAENIWLSSGQDEDYDFRR